MRFVLDGRLRSSNSLCSPRTASPRGIEQYHVPSTWLNAFDVIRALDPDGLLRTIHEAESNNEIGNVGHAASPKATRRSCSYSSGHEPLSDS